MSAISIDGLEDALNLLILETDFATFWDHIQLEYVMVGAGILMILMEGTWNE